jgi:glutathione S-transferase
LGAAIFSFVAIFADRLRRLSPRKARRAFCQHAQPCRRERQEAIVERGVEAPHVVRAIAIWEAGLRSIDKALVDGGPWIMGNAYTLADLCVTPFVARLEYIRYLDAFIAGRPNVAAWWSRVKDGRPSQQPMPRGSARPI